MSKRRGFSLIEMIIFIIIVGITSSLIILPWYIAVQGSLELGDSEQNLSLAQTRIELIIGQRYISSFSTFDDPCTGGSPPAVCNFPPDFLVTANITNNWQGDTNFKVIEVDSTDPQGQTITLTTMVADN